MTSVADPPSRIDNAAPLGLTSEEATRRLAQFGDNAPRASPRASAFREVLGALINPLMLVLLAASAVAAVLGEVVNAIIVAVMVLLSICLNVVQSHRSRRAADRLRQSVAPTATVLRDGAWQEIHLRTVVPGDVIRLGAGDLVPGDATLIESRDLHVQEAALTGESLPQEKHATKPPGATDDRCTRVFLGTSVVSGSATALVRSTGASTSFGQIAERLRERAPTTEFDRGLARLGTMITRTVFFLVLLLVLASIALHRDPLESLLFAVALAVGLVPEFMPMITSVTLANGAVRMARANVIVRHLSAIQNLGSIDVLCSDKTGTLTRAEMQVERSIELRGRSSDDVLALAALNARFETGIRSPLDGAILQAYNSAGEGWSKIDEIPFDFVRRRLSIVAARGHERLLVTKGAPEAVLACCDRYVDAGQTRPADDCTRERLHQQLQTLGAAGLRVLGVASRQVESKRVYTAADEDALVFTGLLCFSDPVLEDAPACVESMRALGVAVKILTGDEEGVARSVCERTGLDTSRIVRGEEVEHMTDTALAQVAERASVFVRMSPQQKNRVILALKARNHVVGYLGDGINDAPSLHTADVGISVAPAVDGAKDTADIILLERGLGVLHTGILEGRKAFGNVTKYLLMSTSSNFGNMFSMAVASVFLPFLPMLPTQILLNNFLYDVAQVTIPTDHVEEEYTRRPQRWNMQALRRFMVSVGPVSSVFDIATFLVLLGVFHATEPFFHTGWFVESLVTQTLVLLVIRTPRRITQSRPSRALVAMIVAVLAVALSLPYTVLAPALGFVALPWTFFAFVVVVTAAYLTSVELVKRPLMRRLLA